ncbi:MAG: bifunctional (p)ppGpp synthetase/guanosine-3',5'-bis(diphosphate) 3'-pyrophosphohydrolase [Treponema sp.]|nr:bifunctional (p)ppGpp synthetase/guanosine-3',5'-bis(diphosphate) 3'-pyrophosphohydrolase [Treponema sp.]
MRIFFAKITFVSTDTVFYADISNKDALLQEFFSSFDFYSKEEKNFIESAWNLLCSKKNADYIHPLRVAYILGQNKMDGASICTAILHNIYTLGETEESIKEKFGNDITNLVNGTAKILRVPVGHTTIHQADSIRKMLFAMVDDVRVILVKLADRLDRIRNIKSLKENSQRALAAEILDIWAPLADRLGMQKEKNEFEDLSLKYSNPDVFLQIKSIVSQKKEERTAYLEKAVQKIQEEANKAGITIFIKSRAKHFYSIYQKMRKRNVDADKLYDLLALRIICTTNAECYTIVGIVHSLWKPLDGRFKDYIAMPKANGYQSLHTTVMCEDKPLEIQIRTRAMNEMAEHGVASHWLYKKGLNHDLVDVNHLGIFNELRKLRDEHVSDENFFNALKHDLLGDEIYVFTPKGEVIKLPQGSNAIDFAYHIHSAIGEKIVGAKADGKIIPLTRPLKNTQVIEILTNPQAHPTSTQLTSVRTSKARQKIHAWLTANGDLANERQQIQKQEQESPVIHHHKKGVRKPSEQIENVKAKIRIGNSTNFFVTLAQCCKPTYPEKILGYVSRNRGVTIHRADCYTYNKIPNAKQRTVEANWETQ